ncbi:MAG: LysR family transcriptional regulator [Anaerolineae bacterium]
MTLNLHLLRIFMTVVEQRSFSAAARALYISQPAVSKSIQEFEQQLGVLLIDRSRRNISLTEPGMILFEYAQQLFAIERAAVRSLAELHGLERGHLAIGASHTTGTYLLPPVLQRFHEQYPGVALSLRIQNTHDIIEELRTVPLDIAFVEGPIENGDLVVTPWKIDQLVVIAPAHHSLGRQERVMIEDVLRFPYIQRESGSGTREIIEQAFEERGLTPKIAIELGSNQVVKQAVIAGLGLSIVSQATVELERKAGAVCVLQVDNFELQRTLSQVTVKDRPVSRALAAFLALLSAE